MSDFIFSLMRIFCRLEAYDMAVIYAQLIIKGKRKYSQVPTKLKDSVKEVLEAMDLDNLDELLAE